MKYLKVTFGMGICFIILYFIFLLTKQNSVFDIAPGRCNIKWEMKIINEKKEFLSFAALC